MVGVLDKKWENDNGSFAGVLKDEKSQIRVQTSPNADVQMEEGKAYRIINAPVKREEKKELYLFINKNTTVEEFDEPVDVGSQTMGAEGYIADTVGQCGYIQRCPECHKPLKDGACTEHGVPDEPEDDLRIMVRLQNGYNYVTAIFQKDLTEELIGKSLAEVKKMPRAEVDELIRTEVRPHYFGIEAQKVRDFLIVKEYEVIPSRV
jgi:ssDNA-binding replication factor A large subunit